MVTSDCGCGEYFKEEDEQQKPLTPWYTVTSEPSYTQPMHVHAMPIQRPQSAHLPNPEPAIGYPLAATPMTVQQPVQVPFPQVQHLPQNVIPFPQPVFQPSMVGTGLLPPPPPPPPQQQPQQQIPIQIPVQMPRPPTIGPPPMQQQPPPGMGRPVPFGPPQIMQPNQPGFGGQPVIMPPMNPHNFNMSPQGLAAVQL